MAEPSKPNRYARASWGGSGIGWAMVADIVTGTFLWGGVGWLLDRWLGTGPWIMIVGFLVGYAMGTYAAILHMRRMQKDAPRQPWESPRDPGEEPGDLI